MKNSLTALLPAVALLALSGCASTGAIATSEDDGVYYSSKDRTTAVVRTAPAAASDTAPASQDEATNPDYNGSAPARSNSGTARSQQREYYDDDYSSSRNNRTYVYAGPGVAYYAPVVYAPYTTLSYGWGGGYCGYSPFGGAICDPFYSPFYSPFYGPAVSINIGFGRPWGYGSYYGSPWGYGYGNPYRYGYGAYDPYYYGGRYYSGYYGGGGYYGGNRNVVYTGSANYGGSGRTVLVGPRRGRGGDVTGGRTAISGNGPVASPSGGGRSTLGGRPAGTPGTSTPGMPTGGRSAGVVRATDAVSTSSYSNAATAAEGTGRRARLADGGRPNATEAPNEMYPSQPALYENGSTRRKPESRDRSYGEAPGQAEMPGTVRPTYVDGLSQQNAEPIYRPARRRSVESAGQVVEQPMAQPEQRSRRGSIFGGAVSQPVESQPARVETRSRSYEQPTYSRPEPASPSYSQPSYGGGNSSGGSSSGGGRRGR